jgi:hypothetical protein
MPIRFGIFFHRLSVSRTIDLEFRAVSVQQFGDVSVDGFICPGGEASPVIFEIFPDDLDKEQCFAEIDDMECLDSALVRSMDQRILAEVERVRGLLPADGIRVAMRKNTNRSFRRKTQLQIYPSNWVNRSGLRTYCTRAGTR